MNLTDEILETYIKKKVNEEAAKVLNDLADAMTERIQNMDLERYQFVDLMNLINHIRS